MRKVMNNLNLELKDLYRLLFIIAIGGTIVFCYLHMKEINGKRVFCPILPGKQWWGFASYILFHGVTSKVQNKLPRPIVHALGIITFSFILVAGLGEYFKFDTGSQLSTTIGSLLGVFSGISAMPKVKKK